MRQAQCAPNAVALTRKITDLRIAVENCILRLKYSHLLCTRLPINTLHGASDVIKVAAVLANLCEEVSSEEVSCEPRACARRAFAS